MKKNRIKILVTGSNGLIGREFCNQLKQKNIIFKGTDTNFNILKKNFYNILRRFKPNIIIHCASHPGGLSFIDPIQNIKTNYIGSVKIINWCIKNKCKFIFLSSSAVYGNRNKKIKIKESDELLPETIYGINKLAIEKFIKNYSKFYNFNWLIFRLFATYGSGHKPNNYQGIVNVIISQIKNNNKLIIKGSLNRSRSLIYVKDAVRIMLDIIFKKINKKIINIGPEKFYTIRSLINVIEKIYNTKFKVQVAKGTPGDPKNNIANVSLMKKYCKIKTQYSLKQGITETIKERNA